MQAERAEFIKNPPKSLEEIERLAPNDDISKIDLRIFLKGLLMTKLQSSEFSKKRFIEAMRKTVNEHKQDAAKVSADFLEICDPVLNQTESLRKGLNRLPRPYREVMAVYQLWGMMTSDGIESYLENTDQKVDAEVDLGLKLLGRITSVGVVGRARKSYDPFDGLPADLEKECEDVFYRDLDEFESNILGKFLIETLTKA